MPFEASKILESLEEELASHKGVIAEIESIIAIIKSAGKTAKSAPPTKRVAARPGPAAKVDGRRSKASYAARAEEFLRASGKPERMTTILSHLQETMPKGVIFSRNAASQAIHSAAQGKSPIVHTGEKRSGLYGLKKG